MNKTNDDIIIFKDCAKITIPAQLQNEAFRFILLRKGKESRKIPAEAGWTKDENKRYQWDSTRLQRHIQRGGNYGVCAGIGELTPLDNDQMELLQDLGILEKLQETFTVRTGSGGFHYYYIIPNLTEKVVLYHPTLKNEKGDYKHLGEILSTGFYVVGPNCIHPNGEQYIVTNDVPIATENRDFFLNKFASVRTTRRNEPKREPSKPRSDGISDQIRIADIAMPIRPKNLGGGEIQGEHPLHGATEAKDRGKSTNFGINTSKNVWICRAHNSGGGPLEWIAVEEGIIRCSEAGPGCLDRGKFRQVIQAAIKRGLIDEEEEEEEEELLKGPVPEIITRRIKMTELPGILPDADTITIRASPRTGKTHKSISYLMAHTTGAYITHRHAIIQHAIEIFKTMGGTSGVWLEGKFRKGMCRFPGATEEQCKKCVLKPNEHVKGGTGYFELQNKAAKLLNHIGVLTKEEVPADMCPYYTLNFAEEYARYCFTVVNNIEKLQPRKITILDEDPTTSFFYPPSIKIAKIKRTRGETHIINLLSRQEESLKKLKRDTKYRDKAIELIDILDRAGDIGIEELAETLTTALAGWDPKSPPSDFEDGDLDQLMKCLSAIYQDHPISVVNGKGGYRDVYLIGDESKMIKTPPPGKYVIIGTTLAEILAKKIDPDALVIEIDQFRYADRFLVIPVKGKTLKEERTKIMSLLHELGKDSDDPERYPILVLTGSKSSQHHMVDALGGIASASTDEGETGQEWNYIGGKINVFYQNSVISRGLDVDQYKVLVVHDCNFAQPYWSLADKTIAAMINRDETTNAVLRISPTQKRDDDFMRVIVLPEHDLTKVQFLDDQVRGDGGAETSQLVKVVKSAAGKLMIAGGVSGILAVVKTGESNHISLIELLEKESEAVDEMEIIRVTKCVQQLGRDTHKWISRKELVQVSNCTRAVYREAMMRLYVDGKWETTGAGNNAKWRRKRKPAGIPERGRLLSV